MLKNSFGLSRNIPAEIKREIRKNSGFGCVICCSSIWQYEHIDPPFAQARSHDPNKMTLLCPTHHQQTTSRLLSKATVEKARLSPCTSKKGFSSSSFDFADQIPSMTFAGEVIKNCQTPVIVDGSPLFEVKPGEESGAPFRLSGDFYDANGNLILQIIDNEWRIITKNSWDANVEGQEITIKDDKKRIVLQIIADAPKGLIIKRINMYTKNLFITGNSKKLFVKRKDGEMLDLSNKIGSGININSQDLNVTKTKKQSPPTRGHSPF